MRQVSICGALMATALAVSTVHAQFQPIPVPAAAFERADRPVIDTVPDPEDPSGPILGAFILGGVGFAVGTLTWDLDALILMESIGIGLGAHIGNHGRGSLLAPLLASLAVMSAARFVTASSDDASHWILVVPFVQISASVIAETVTARRRGSR